MNELIRKSRPEERPGPSGRRPDRSARTGRGPVGLLAAGALVAGVVLPLAFQGDAQAAATPNGGDVIANLFEWNWKSVASECTDVLGPKGYGAVQVAPPADSIKLNGAHPWWEVYQPVSYSLNSRMGTEAQFKAMVTACHNAGVKVYADAVLNHTVGVNQTSGSSYGGAAFNPAAYTYNDIPYGRADFHGSPPCPNADLGINDWNSVAQVQECQSLSLSDLNTESDSVRGKIAGYLNSMVAAGVDGFRMDAAKHVAQADMAAILSRVHDTAWGGRPYIYQEIFPGSGGQLAPAAFEGNGSVLEFTYAFKLKDQFNGNIANLKTFGQSWGLEPSDKSAVMVTNHDLERDQTTLTYNSGAKYNLAHVFELAWGYGTPQVYSGFRFGNRDDSPPADANGFVTDTNCSTNTWTCTDRNQGIANMVGWHNAAQGQAVANWWDNGNNAIAFSRGNKAWVAINNSSTAVTQTFSTGLAAGTYCDVIHGDLTATGACTGTTVTVDASGKATTTVPPGDAVALRTGVGGTTPSPSTSPSGSPSTSPSGTPSGSPSPSTTPADGTTVFYSTDRNWPAYNLHYAPNGGSWTTAPGVAMTPACTGWVKKSIDLGGATGLAATFNNGAGTWDNNNGNNYALRTGAVTVKNGVVGSGDPCATATSSPTPSATAAPSTAGASFAVNATTATGQSVYLVGNTAALGNWNTGAALPLSPASYPVWKLDVAMAAGTAFEYKYIRKDASGNVTWESGANHTATVPASGNVTLNDTWRP
ncbi:carbohydrate-binding module family 20 domain-containing protein [Kitasatospora sp. NPDC005751]|uniref:carbohydrate-binding module family 20 domain-containing protein n=1 Tax=Kitasatospora sp. NPDC005751 TaxID=3157064 RepID=UPI0033C3A584